jgi:AraC-like DNA-binding protein
METDKYLKKSPAGVFRGAVESTVKHDSRERMHYEYSYKVEIVSTGCDFLDHFAALVTRHGNVHAKHYAAMLGVTEKQLTATITALSGAGFRDWTDEFAGAVAEALLRGTNWQVARISRAALMSSPRAFNYFFRRRYKCTPQEWRWANR